MNNMYALKSLVIVILIDSLTSVEDIKLNDLTIKTVSSLLNILSKSDNDLKYVIIQPNKLKPKEHRENSIVKTYHSRFYNGVMGSLAENKRFRRPGKHVILIKRLIPHGLPPSKLEFDKKYKTYYRPLVRVHKIKKLPKIGTILNIDGNTNGIDKYGIDFYDYYDNDENVLKFATNAGQSGNLNRFKVNGTGGNFKSDEELLQPFTANFTQNYNSPDEISLTVQLILLKEIQKLLRKTRSRSSRAKIYNSITKVLDKIENLRSTQKSGEDDDMRAPGTLTNVENEDAQEGLPKPEKWIPHYPPWNFWTYKKTIYQDVCPESQVKIGNLCIWIPPH